MSSSEFSEWQAFSRLEPFGHQRFDFGFAQVSYMIYTMMRAPKSEAKHLQDFILRFNKFDVEAEEAAQVAGLSEKMAVIFGGQPPSTDE